MASFHHRNLIFESLDSSTEKTCSSYYCNPKVYYSAGCPLSCFAICPSICLLSEIQPPTPPPPPSFSAEVPPQKPTISIFLIILVSVLATAIIIFCGFVVYRFGNLRTPSQPQQQTVVIAEEEEEESIGVRTVGLQPSVVSAITICKYKRGEGLIEGTECSVCLNEFQDDETLRVLPKCNHTYHILCIDTWLRSHTNCPMCRTGIVLEQNLGLRHEGETRPGISGNATD